MPSQRLSHAALLSPVFSRLAETPLQRCAALSSQLQNHVFLKREDNLPTYSASVRGALSGVAALKAAGRLENGLVTVEDGTNFGQGAAFAAAQLGAVATVVVPKITRPQARADLQSHGAELLEFEDDAVDFSAAVRHAQEVAEGSGRPFLHPHDDFLVCAGFGTAGVELMRQSTGELSRVYVPATGGGGLLTGVAAVLKEFTPDTEVWGVEVEGDAAPLAASLEVNARVTLSRQLLRSPSANFFASGSGVRSLGSLNYRVCRDCVEGVVTVTADEVCAAIRDAFESSRVLLEPQGAMAIAGLKHHAQREGYKDERVAAIVSGASMEFDRLRFVAERSDSSEVFLAVAIPEEPGSFHKLYSSLSPRNVTEFSYRMGPRSRRDAHVLLIFQELGQGDGEATVRRLSESYPTVIDLREDELAKTHLRYLSGGAAIDSLGGGGDGGDLSLGGVGVAGCFDSTSLSDPVRWSISWTC